MKLPTINERRGNCYVASEALYHILGGPRSGWTPMRIRVGKNCVHWFLKHKATGLIIDPAGRQFRARGWWKKPDYSKARGSGFLTKFPSERAVVMIQHLTWSLPWTSTSRPRSSSHSRKAGRSSRRTS